MLLLACLAVLSMNIAFGTSQAMLPLYLSNHGVTQVTLGTIISTAALVPFALAIPLGWLTDRRGPGATLRLVVAAGAAAVIGIVLMPGAVGGWLVYALLGLSLVGTAVALQSTIGSTAPPGDQERQFGLFAGAAGLGQVVAPALGGMLVQHMGFTAMFLVGLAALAVPFWASFFLPAAAGQAVADRLADSGAWGRLVALFGDPGLRRVLLVGVLGTVLPALGGSYVPYYLDRLGYTPAETGLLLSTMAAATTGVRVGAGPLVGRFGRPVAIRGALVAGTAGLGLLALPLGAPAHLAAMVLLGVGATIPPLLMAAVTRFASGGDMGLVMGVQMMSLRSSQLLAPVCFGLITLVLSVSHAFLAVAAALLAAGWVLLGPPPRRAPG